MKQNEQMREALQAAISAMRGIYGGWRCESAIKLCEQALAAKPAKLVRLTDEEISLFDKQYLDIEPSGLQVRDFANAIMDAMEEKNK